MNKELITGAIGTGIGVVGTALQPNEILQIISIIITILGGLVSFIIVPLLHWYSDAKKDGRIDLREIQDGAETLKDGLDKTKEQIEREKGKSDVKNQDRET